MSNQFSTPFGDIERYFVTESWLIDQYVGDKLWTWGQGSSGQLGINATANRSTPVTTLPGGTNWQQVSVGKSHTAAIKLDGTLWTWGSNASGELGINASTNRSTPVTTIVGGTNWRQVSSGDNYTTAVKTDGTLWTWGDNTRFQLGKLSSNLTTYSLPITIDGNNWADTATTAPEDLYTLSANSNFSAAIKTDGTLWTWGLGGSGRLGNNDTTARSTPITTFAGGTDWKELSLGNVNIAAIKTDGTLWTWGGASLGRLGTNDTINRSTPVTTFVGGTNWKQVSSFLNHVAAVKTDGTLWTWGASASSQLGRPTTLNYEYIPVTTFAGGNNWADTATAEPEDLYTLSSGGNFSAAIKTDGTLWTWGLGTSGQLGDNTITTVSTPITTFAGGTDWKQVSSGGAHTAAIKTDGTLWVWGANASGQLGTNALLARSTPVTTFTGGTNWKEVSAGSNHTAAIKTDGTLWVWGNGNVGRLGINATTNRSIPVTTFAGGSTAGGNGWKQVSCGDSHTTAVKTDGTLWTWGFGTSGQLGANAVLSRSTPITTFTGGTNWKQVNAGTNFSAAIKTDGTLWTWGLGTSGQLGDNTITSISRPSTTFAGGTDWKQVHAGGTHVGAVKTDGTLWTWGNGANGRLGNANTTNRSTPITTFAGGTNWKQVNVGTDHTLALKDDGVNKELYVFGDNSTGELGINAYDNSSQSIPVQVFPRTSSDWKQVAVGDLYTTAIKTDGTLWVWGNAGSGRLGNNNAITEIPTPVTTFVGGTNWSQVGAGSSHTAAIKTDGTLWIWGNGTNGKLGTNDTIDRSTPVTTFIGGTNWKQVNAGDSHFAAVKTDGTLWTWGVGSLGRLGTNDTINRSTPSQTSLLALTWKQVSAGTDHTIALSDDGTNKNIYVFGNHSGAYLGLTPSVINYSTPSTTFVGGGDWKQTSSGDSHTAAIKLDGTLWTWGFNAAGQLGRNNIFYAITPVTTFVGGTNWKQVGVGSDFSAAIKTDGTLWTWGNNSNGRLGTNDPTNRLTPVTTITGGNLESGTGWIKLSIGNEGSHIAAIKTDGTLWTWGKNNAGQLGTNDTLDKSTPVTTFVGGINWKQIGSGSQHTAAVKTDGTLWVWGEATLGKLGTNDSINRSTPVTTFAGGTNWKQVSSGTENTNAVTNGEEMFLE